MSNYSPVGDWQKTANITKPKHTGINREKYTFCIIQSLEPIKNLKSSRVHYLWLELTVFDLKNEIPLNVACFYHYNGVTSLAAILVEKFKIFLVSRIVSPNCCWIFQDLPPRHLPPPPILYTVHSCFVGILTMVHQTEKEKKWEQIYIVNFLSPAFRPIYEGAIGQSRETTSPCNTLGLIFQHWTWLEDPDPLWFGFTKRYWESQRKFVNAWVSTMKTRLQRFNLPYTCRATKMRLFHCSFFCNIQN